MFVRAHQKVKSSRFPDSDADRALASDPAFNEVCDERSDALREAFESLAMRCPALSTAARAAAQGCV